VESLERFCCGRPSTANEEGSAMSRFYSSFEEFARDEIAPGNRVGWSMDELEIESTAVEELNLDDEDEEYEED
jgi:hypothetical protein